jgi:Holin of 3TMs, for gene-transfer release
MWQLLIGPVSELINTVLKRVLPPEKMSEADRAKLEAEITLELSKQDWEGIKGQLQINLEEAKSTNWFVAGWRPCIGWICGAAFAWHFVLEPLLSWVLVVIFHYSFGASLPKFDMESLLTVLLGMLGLGGLRTFEKYKEISRG